MISYIPTNDEKFTLELYKRKENSPYEYEDKPAITFKGRPASQLEIKKYRVQKGVNGNTDSIFVKCSNLPLDVTVNDKIKFIGKIWSVASVGYYFDDARFVNANCLNEEQIIARCPKGLNLQ